MNYTFPTNDIVKATLEGIKDAHESCLSWTNKKAWLSMAPEYMINIHIGKRLAELKNKPEIWFETSISDLADSIELTDTQKEAFIENIQRNNYKSEKIDIVLDDGEYSKILIEVKNSVDKCDPLVDDIIRVCNALKYESKLDFGAIAFFANVNDKKTIQTLIISIEKCAQKIINENDFSIKPVQIKSENIIELGRDENDGWSCAAICFVLEKKESVQNFVSASDSSRNCIIA